MNKINYNNNNIIPIKYYYNIIELKSIILKDNRKKSGIYKWTNKVNNKFYVGSSLNLSNRFKEYLSSKRLERNILKSKSLIYNSMLKYNYDNFILEVLEYCEPNVLIEREQYFLNLLEPKYNICKIAYSRLGTKLSEETKIKISIKNKGINNAMYGKFANHQAIGVKVLNISTNEIKLFPSIRRAANYINIHHSWIANNLNKYKIYKNRDYIVTINNK